MGWLFWMFLMWFVFSRLSRRRRRWRSFGPGAGMWWMSAQCHPGHGRFSRHQVVMMSAEPPRPLSPAERRERAMADLRKRYVADEINVEEYEAGLDRVLRES